MFAMALYHAATSGRFSPLSGCADPAERAVITRPNIGMRTKNERATTGVGEVALRGHSPSLLSNTLFG